MIVREKITNPREPEGAQRRDDPSGTQQHRSQIARPRAIERREPARRRRIEEVVSHRTRSLVVVLEEVHDPHNLSAVLRTCECFGVQEIYVVEGPTSPFQPTKLVARGADKWLDVRRSDDLAATLAGLRARGLRVLGSRLDPSALPLPEVPHHEPLALVFGNESRGLSEEAIERCDGFFQIPMFGFTQSLNISVAAAVSLAWLTLHRAAENGGSPGDLPGEDALALADRFATRGGSKAGGRRAGEDYDD